MFTPVQRAFLYEAVSVTNSGATLLEIRFARVKRGPKVNGIEIIRAVDTDVTTQAPSTEATTTTTPVVTTTSTTVPTTTTVTTEGPPRPCHRLDQDGVTCLKCKRATDVPVGSTCQANCLASQIKLYDAGGNNPWCVPAVLAAELAEAGDYEVAWVPPRRFPRVFRRSNQAFKIKSSTLPQCLEECRAMAACVSVFYNFERRKCHGLKDTGAVGRSAASAFPALSLTLRRGGVVSPDTVASAAGYARGFEEPGRRFSTALQRSARVFREKKMTLAICLEKCTASPACLGVYYEGTKCTGLSSLGRVQGHPVAGRAYSYVKATAPSN